MADLDQIQLPNGGTYNFKDTTQVRSDHRHYESDIVPLIHKTYASNSYYATTGGDYNTSSWYFMSVKPDSWYKPWTVKFKAHTSCPNYASYESITYATISGRSNDIVYANWNERQNSAHYYITVYPLKEAGFNAGYGHAIGMCIIWGDNYINSNYYRTFEIDYYSCENCTVTLLDSPVKWPNWPGGTTTNYGGLIATNAVSRGLQESGDTDSTGYNIRKIYSLIKAGSNKVFPYTFIMECADGRWESLVTSNSTSTNKSRNTHGFRLGKLFFMQAGNTYNENVVLDNYRLWYMYSDLLDHRYSFNTANNATDGTVANQPVYLVGSLGSDGLFYLDTKWWTQTLPTTADGKLYIYLGMAYDYYRMTFDLENPIYHYVNGMLREFTQDAGTVNGYTVAKDVPSNAIFTDNNTTYTFANGTNGFTVTPSGGSAQTVTVTPSIANNVTGSGTSGYIAKFNGGNTITNGPAIGTGTTKYLREDGTWQTPSSSSDTTYTIGTSGNNITLTPSSGSVQSITAPYATSAGSAASATSATSATTASKLGSSNVGSATNPIYLNGGTATVCTYSLHKTVPSDAVFTDTTYSSLPAASGGTDVSLVTTGEKYNWNNGCTDTKVEQIVTTNSDNNEYRVLLSGNANDTTETTTVRKPINLTYNCKTHTLSAIFINAHGGISTSAQIEAAHVKSTGAVLADGAVYSDNGIFGNQIYARYYNDTDEDYVDTIQLDGDTGKIYCNSMSVIDISDQYIPSKTSGNWSIGSDDGVYRIKAYRMGNLIQMSIAFHGNGSAVSSGSNGFVGAIEGGPLPVQQVALTGFYSSSILAATLDIDGSITVRPFSASCTLSNASRAYLTGTFICIDDAVVDVAEEHQ